MCEARDKQTSFEDGWIEAEEEMKAFEAMARYHREWLLAQGLPELRRWYETKENIDEETRSRKLEVLDAISSHFARELDCDI